ncbi:conserved hypothetical protein [Methanohalobium evestigatum Z-7303]|uniref:Uncharacterized protein n=1 Tax=Methanohalobium evestigatum (strain ATCC BAA-1072 / DSM 3721 / NBRC 107634 / OCM 161 / Z-7303) TaxID=644295 RepID=D7E9X9_METEZ|nr:hypothetical protein [Methanohalobium evestigatum]ADI74401.1 conserved hypothetical protein [Methanohalobium evestigatum Z-7303]
MNFDTGDNVKLEQTDKESIMKIVAARYFTNQNWKWINLKSEINKIYKAYDELNEQYNAYPYMSRDWYVANSATKNIHMCEKWNELKELMGFLESYAQHFDFMVKNGDEKFFCIISDNSELSSDQKNAIDIARKSQYKIYEFNMQVPDEVAFEISQL